jgi:hypothetical protein
MVTGNTFEEYLNEVWIPESQLLVYKNGYFLGAESPFGVVGPGECPGGDDINIDLDVAETTSAALYGIGDPMVAPDVTTTVKATFSKDLYQGSAKTYELYKLYQQGRDGSRLVGSQDDKALKAATKNLIDVFMAQALADLPAWIDSTSAFSDAALDRAVYTALVSYEAGAVGDLAVADLEDALEAMENTTYGPVDRGDMVWVMARNQLTNLSRLTTGVANLEMISSSQGGAPVDGDRTRMTKSFGDVPIYVVPGFSTTTILLLNASKIKIYNWAPLQITPKQVNELAQSWLLNIGATLVVENPREQAKLPGITA